MRRQTTLVLGVLVIVFLGGVMMTSIGSTTQKITPQDVAEDDFGGEVVKVEGVINSEVRMGDTITFQLAGNRSMANESVAKSDFDLDKAAHVQVVYEPQGSTPATLQEGRRAIVTGEVRDGVVYANQVTVDAHGSQSSESS